MRCEHYREAISARMDGEDVPELGTPSEADAAVEEHLAGCAGCRAYADRAAHVTRLARIRPAEPGPDLLPGVLAATPDGPPRRSRRTWVLDGVRAALAALGVGQLGLAVSGVVAGTGHDGHGELAGASVAHFSHESAAWNLAIGVAFLWVATGPARRSDGLVPVVGAFVALLLALSALDLLAGRVDASRLVGHGLVVAGLVLLVLHRRLGSGGGGTAAGDDRRHDAGTGPATAARRAGPTGPARPVDGGLEPTARRPAA